MQLFPCPFCGPRNEREFHYIAEPGKTRPDTTGDITAEDWAAYLYDTKNEKGPVREVWMHLTCRELFVMERDSVTMDVLGSKTLRRPLPAEGAA